VRYNDNQIELGPKCYSEADSGYKKKYKEKGEASAKFKDEVLEIRIPKTEEAKKKEKKATIE
jgi:hypothetical protein